jgi:uncharacterized protein YjcR
MSTQKKRRKDVKWIEKAIKNGISYSTYVSRVDRLNWLPEKASSTPPTQGKNKRWIAVAQKNGISPDNFYDRIRAGWSEKDAATIKKQVQKKRFDRSIIELAKENGISYNTLLNRVKKFGWDPKKAAATPVLSRGRTLEIAREANNELRKKEQSVINADPDNLFKITPQHIELAKKNGISKLTVRSRVYRDGWTVDEAITTPVQEKKSAQYYRYKDIALSNGIHPEAFKSRVRIGWTFEKAATVPSKAIDERKRNDAQWIEKALENGINYRTYLSRMRYGWMPEEAATTGRLNPGEFLNDERKERAKEGFKKFRDLTGKWGVKKWTKNSIQN